MAEQGRAGRGGGLGVVAATYGVGIASWWLYNHAGPDVANRVIFSYAICLLAGPVIVYATLRRRGAAGLATPLALGIPLLWLAKELYRVSGVHPAGESLYFALNPIAVGVYCAALAPIALAEILLRHGELGGWHLRGWPGAVLVLFGLLGLGAAVVGHDNGGREIFYAYVALYRWLFA